MFENIHLMQKEERLDGQKNVRHLESKRWNGWCKSDYIYSNINCEKVEQSNQKTEIMRIFLLKALTISAGNTFDSKIGS